MLFIVSYFSNFLLSDETHVSGRSGKFYILMKCLEIALHYGAGGRAKDDILVIFVRFKLEMISRPGFSNCVWTNLKKCRSSFFGLNELC